jgi:hypothetical protein
MNQGFMEKLGRFSQENGKKNEKIWENAENKWDYSGMSWEHQRLYLGVTFCR